MVSSVWVKKNVTQPDFVEKAMTDVVITGVGAITPLGDDAPSTWQNMLAGTSGIVTITEEWADDLMVKIAGTVKGDTESHFERAKLRRLDPVSRLTLIAATEAWQDAGYSLDNTAANEGDTVDPERLAVSIGTSMGGLHSLLDTWDTQINRGARRTSPFAIPMLMLNAGAAQVGMKFGARAEIHTPVSACASGNEAISHGIDLLRLGRADVVIVGGSDSLIHPFVLSAFNQMQALSRNNDDPQHASRPWDIDRDGFVLSEGACMMVIETLDHA